MAVSVDPTSVPTTVKDGRDELSLRRLYALRFGYLVVGLGLVMTKWPLFLQRDSWEVMEGVVNVMLTAMSLLALLGLKYPVRMLPVLLFESAWKLIWLAAVGIPHLIAGDMDARMSSVLFNVSLVVVILAVTPWDYVWKRYVRAPGDPWR